MKKVTIVGGGLAGCEAALQLAARGIEVGLIEMRPAVSTPAHKSEDLAEIVCSNSLKSTLEDTASGLLKNELQILESRLLEAAYETSIPAGHALAVDRSLFSALVTQKIENIPGIQIKRSLQKDLNLPKPCIIATGPLTDGMLLNALKKHFGKQELYFYDAIAPTIDSSSIDRENCFRASRYAKGTPDYINIPLDSEEYNSLVNNIKRAEIQEPHSFENNKYFEACLPIEIMAGRGEDTLRFGPLKPKGLIDPNTGKEPFAVIQLRQETKDGSLLGLVGFQTRMTRACQKKVIRSIKGLKNAEILRFGAMHRNVFINTPELCSHYQKDIKLEGIFYAGQLCGVEGYVECICSGLVTALAVYSYLHEKPFPPLPAETMTGALMNYIHTPKRDFQPMNANMGLLPDMPQRIRNKRERRKALAGRAMQEICAYKRANSLLFG